MNCETSDCTLRWGSCTAAWVQDGCSCPRATRSRDSALERTLFFNAHIQKVSVDGTRGWWRVVQTRLPDDTDCETRSVTGYWSSQWWVRCGSGGTRTVGHDWRSPEPGGGGTLSQGSPLTSGAGRGRCTGPRAHQALCKHELSEYPSLLQRTGDGTHGVGWEVLCHVAEGQSSHRRVT